MSNSEILRLENVSKFYKTANNVALGIRKVNASFKVGEFVLITGASGSGKSTLINVLSGMTSYEEGTMYINGEDSSYYGYEEYEKFRKDYIACIFQNYNIIDSYSVYENIELALIARGVKKEERKPIIIDVAKKVGISGRLKNKVTRLSGGEKQRVAIARALVSDAPILVCDEITGNLDHDTSLEIVELLHSLSEGKLVLMVTHDPEEVMQYATRIITMHDGQIQNDKVLKEVNYSNDVKIKTTNPIKKRDIVKLAAKSFKNTPKKSILLVLIILIATIFIGFACASIGTNSDSLTSGLYDYYGGDFNYDKRRILVKKEDESVFSEADYNNLKNAKHVGFVLNSDRNTDSKLYGYYNDYEEEFYYSIDAFCLPSNVLTAKSLTGGTLPSSDNEIIIQSKESNYEDLKKMLNKEIVLYSGSYGASINVKVVGYIISEDAKTNVIYLTDNIYNQLSRINLYSDTNVSLQGYYYSTTFLEATNLPANSVVAYVLEDGGKDLASSKVAITWEENGELQVIEDVNISKKNLGKYSETFNEAGITSVNNFSFEECYSIIGVSSDIYNQINANKQYQVSVYADDAKNASSLSKELINMGYIAVIAYYESENTGEILSIILNVFLYIFCIVLTLVIYLLAHLSLKNIIYSERKDLLIQRSLGINVKQVTAQIYIKLVGISIVTTLLFIATSIALHNVYFPTYHILYSVSKMHILEMVYTFLLMICMTFFLSRKFAKNIFKANIASKDKEEPLQ